MFPSADFLSWSWSLVQRSMSAAYRSYRFCESASPLAFAPVLRVSASNTAGWYFKPPGSSLSASSTLLQSVTNDTSSGTAARSASPELSCPAAHAVCRVHYGLALPASRFRLQGLDTLLTVFSSTNLANPVSGRQRSWASPFEAFSSRRAPRHSCRADPHAVGASRRLPVRWTGSANKSRRLLGFATETSSSRSNRTIRFGRRRMLPWALPF